MRFSADEDVFCYGQIGTKIDFLIDCADANFLGVLRRPDLNNLAIQLDGAGIWVLHSSQNLNQGGFARSILTDQGVDLAEFQRKIDVFQGNDTRKCL